MNDKELKESIGRLTALKPIYYKPDSPVKGVDARDDIKNVLAELDKHRWHKVCDSFPEYDVIVQVANGKFVTTAILRCEHEGWYWEQHCFGDVMDHDNYEMDDDYQYTHWKPITLPEEEQ